MDQVGRVLDAVEDNGLSESTVIMFVGDHGYQMGEHSEWLKNNNFEISHRAPMLLHVPGVIDQVGCDLSLTFTPILTLSPPRPRWRTASWSLWTSCPPWWRPRGCPTSSSALSTPATCPSAGSTQQYSAALQQ